ncbi:MAG: metalloprotease PmbA [Pseudomonadota bacterium]
MNDVEKSDITVSKEQLIGLINDVLQEARRLGADQASAAATVDAGLTVTSRFGEVETVEYQKDRGMGVTVYMGKKKGTASTSDLDPDQVRSTVAKACSIAGYTQEDTCAGLAEAELMPKQVRDLDLNHPWSLTPEDAMEITQACEQVALGFDERIKNSEGATAGRHQALRVYGNSHGFIDGYHSTSHSLSCSVLAQQNGAMERDYWYTSSRNPQHLESAEQVGKRAAERTVRRLGAQKLSTRKVPILFPPELAKGLMAHCIGALSGGSQYREASFLLGAAGQQIFPEFVNFKEKPHLLQAIGSAPFDNEGVETCDRVLIDQGIIQGYVLSSYSGRKLNLPTTGNAGGVRNMEISGGEKDFDELLKEMDTGFYVSELIGHGVNMVTGDYSRGAAGFWVQGGEIQHAVSEVTVAGNLKDIYQDLVAVGNDLDTRGSLRCGSVLVSEMTVAGE